MLSSSPLEAGDKVLFHVVQQAVCGSTEQAGLPRWPFTSMLCGRMMCGV